MNPCKFNAAFSVKLSSRIKLFFSSCIDLHQGGQFRDLQSSGFWSHVYWKSLRQHRLLKLANNKCLPWHNREIIVIKFLFQTTRQCSHYLNNYFLLFSSFTFAFVFKWDQLIILLVIQHRKVIVCFSQWNHLSKIATQKFDSYKYTFC